MSASIDDVLSFRAPNGSPTSVLPPQLAILVLDTLEAPADFLFVHLLSRAFKQGRHCCLVGVNRDKEYYNTVLKKHGVQLQTHLKAGTGLYIDAGKGTSFTGAQPESTAFGHILDQVAQALQTFQVDADNRSTAAAPPPPMIFIDDLSSLLWSSGAEPAHLAAFYRHIRSLTVASNATLLSTFHADACFPNMTESASTLDHESDTALKLLIRLSHLWLTTRSLRAQMMGELTLHRGPALGTDHPSVTSMPRHRPVQYKIEETGPVIWSKGTGAGFL